MFERNLILIIVPICFNMSSTTTRKTKSEIDDPEFRITPVQQGGASCTGALLTSLLVTPLDVVKIRLQAQNNPKNKCFLYCNGLMDHLCGCNSTLNKEWLRSQNHFKGTIDAFIKISRNEGITALWSGLAPTLVLAIPTTILYFVSYEQLRLKLKDWYNKNEKGNFSQPFWIPLTAGASARILAVTSVNPLELIRTKMQSQQLTYLELKEALSSLIKKDGIRGLWKGTVPTLLRDVPFSSIYWCTYEAIKQKYVVPGENPKFTLSFFAGATSGSIAALFTTPFDVVKTKKQIEFGEKFYNGEPVKSRSSLEISKSIYQNYGIKGFYTGLTPRIIKVAPSCAIMISTFEYSKIFFHRLANRSENYIVRVKNTKNETL